jgi:hypothetical protein
MGGLLMTPKSGRVIAWLSFLLGIGVSIAGNVGHAASDGMKPGEWAGAAFWPLALMLTIEILTRVNWQPGKRWTAARIAGLILVAAVAAILSYRHLAGLMTYWGEDWANAHLGPLAVDGLMLVAATALLSISHEKPAVAEPVLEVGELRESMVTQEGLDALWKAEQDGRNWADESQALVADPAYLNNLEPPEKPKVEKPERLHIVNAVSTSVAEEAALQAWIDSNRTLSSSQVAEMIGVSKSTAHRRMQKWPSDGRRIVR